MTSPMNERSVEIPWLQNSLRFLNPKTILDVGSAEAQYHWDLFATGAHITFQDVRDFSVSLHPDILKHHRIAISPAPFPSAWVNSFDLVTCISTLDHVGLEAYDQPPDPAALPLLVSELHRILHPHDGHLLLTVPVGDPRSSLPHQRVFSQHDLFDLFPVTAWSWRSVSLFRLHHDSYLPVHAWFSVTNATYLTNRAEAVACIHLQRVLS